MSCIAKMKLGICALVVMLASAAQAQFIADRVELETPAGRIEILDSRDGFSRTLQVGDLGFFKQGDYRYISIQAQRGALYLLELSSGGSACAAEYAWLHTEGSRARLGPTFGTCAMMDSVSSDAETVTVTMQAFEAADGFVDFIYDGEAVTEHLAGQRNSGIGQDADDWVGRYPFEIFSDAGWRDPLIALMGEDGYRRAGNTIQVSSPMERQGPWVVGRGCRNRQCDIAFGAIALHDDGPILVALRTQDTGLEVFGVLAGTPPDVIADVMKGR